MRSILGAFLIAVIAFADDKSFCEKKCGEKYTDEELRNACVVGCGGRASISEGPFSFVDCYRNCDNKFSKGNETKEVSETHAACSYACSLPVSRSVFMSVNYANGEKPVVKIVRKEGDEVSTSIDRAPLTGDVDVDRFVANILGDMNSHLLSFRNPFNPSPSQDINTSRDMMMGPHHGQMMAVHDRMNEMLAAFSRQFFDGIRRQMHRQHHLAMHRPAGHENIAHMGPEIGNMMSNGDPIIITHPLSGFEEDEAKVRPIKVVRYQMTTNHPPSVFYWIMIVFGIGALLLTLYASVIFFRVMRSAAYRRISGDAPGRRPAAPPAPGAIPVKKVPLDGWVEHSEPAGVPPPAYDQMGQHASVIFFRVMRSAAYRRISGDAPGRRPAAPPAPGAIPVKKVPLDGWVEHSEPAGVPPPAYDQVSIHSIHKQKIPDPAEQPLSEAGTISPNASNEQK
ncbi:hypothetical protein RB195_020179 [Necator americanus]|uniref:Uncharacterized protein n=1 Tax=Necator americanus TaxID=51031 RepID=A0ABR1CKD8_NECAM